MEPAAHQVLGHFFGRLFCQQSLMSDLWVVKEQIQAARCGEPEKVLSPARFWVNAGPCPAVRRVIYYVLFPIAMQQARTVVWNFFIFLFYFFRNLFYWICELSLWFAKWPALKMTVFGCRSKGCDSESEFQRRKLGFVRGRHINQGWAD